MEFPFPGEGRGPVIQRSWTPAFAGEQVIKAHRHP